MTFLGKILVVVHLFLSVLFMAFAGAVYTAQTNWRTRAETALKASDSARQQAQSQANELNAQITALQQQLTTTQNDKVMWEGRATVSEGEKQRVETELNALKLAFDGQRNIADLNSQESEERTKEAQVQRARNMELNQSRDNLVVELNQLRDKLFGTELNLKQTEERYNAILKTNAVMRAYLASKDLPTDPRLMTVSAAPPPSVYGKILGARKEEKGNRVLVEISLGKDDGLIPGHTMTVYRNDKFLGRIRLEDVSRPNRSVGVVVETAPNSTIEVEDNVTTKF